MSATTIARQKDVWTNEHKRWSERDLSAKSYVYVSADGVYLQARLEAEAQCILVIIGATPEGKKELLAFVDGAREGLSAALRVKSAATSLLVGRTVETVYWESSRTPPCTVPRSCFPQRTRSRWSRLRGVRQFLRPRLGRLRRIRSSGSRSRRGPGRSPPMAPKAIRRLAR